MSGLAVQASDTANGAKGGVITIEALLDLDVKNSSTEAKGSTAVAAARRAAPSTSDPSPRASSPTWNSKIDVTGGNPANGVVNLKACTTFGFPPGTVVPPPSRRPRSTSCGRRAGSAEPGSPVSSALSLRWLPCVNTFRFVAGAPSKIRPRRRPAEGARRGAVGPGQWEWRCHELEPTAGVPVPFSGAKTDAALRRRDRCCRWHLPRHLGIWEGSCCSAK